MKKVLSLLVFGMLKQVAFGQSMDWVSLPQEPDGKVTAMIIYQNKLVVGGMFKYVGGIEANGIAAWDGTSWTTFGNGLKGNLSLINKMIVYENELCLMGRFDSVGNAAAKNIARWNGNEWSRIGNAPNGDVRTAAVYNNLLYIGGQFDTIGGQRMDYIARWKDDNWEQVGSGLKAGNILGLCIHKGELYATGQIATVNGVQCEGITRWNDTIWNTVSTGYNNSGFAMSEWNGSLIAGSTVKIRAGQGYQRMMKWNGASWNVFSMQQTERINGLAVVNNKLYAYGGTATGVKGDNYLYNWNEADSTWEKAGTGLNNTIAGVCWYKDELYCGGSFNKNDSSDHNYLARYASTTGIHPITQNRLPATLYPNPNYGRFTIRFKLAQTADITIDLTDVTGKIIYTQSIKHEPEDTPEYKIGSEHLKPGMYFCRIVAGEAIAIQKMVISE